MQNMTLTTKLDVPVGAFCDRPAPLRRRGAPFLQAGDAGQGEAGSAGGAGGGSGGVGRAVVPTLTTGRRCLR